MKQTSKLLLLKNLLALKLRSLSVVLHVTCMHARERELVASYSRPRPAALGVIASMSNTDTVLHGWVIILRGCICACVLAIDFGFVTTPRVLHVFDLCMEEGVYSLLMQCMTLFYVAMQR